jgi:hypothetical protein
MFGLFNDAFSNNSDYKASNNRTIDELCFGDDVEGKGIIAQFQCLNGLRRTTKTSIRITGLRAEI